MKFSNGQWMSREGIDVSGTAQAYKIKNDDKSMAILATTRFINHRGDTLGGPVFNVKLTSPMQDVIRVQISHFKGAIPKGPNFELECNEDINVNIFEDETTASLTTGNLSVRINKDGNWSMDFYNGDQKLTGSSYKSIAYIKDDNTKTTYMRDQLSLSVGENIYGLGERFTPFVKNGQSIDIWNEDGGTSTEQSYKNIPFYITNKGYGVLVNHPECVSFEVGSEHVEKVQFSVTGESLDYFIFNGPTMKEVIQRYTSLTGKPSLPPAWTFGLWLTTSFTTNYDEKTIMSFVDGMAERDLPLHVFHFDCFWMKGFNWCDFEWDSEVFPDPKGMIKRMKDKRLKICVWINSYIAQESKLFDEGVEGGYFIKKPNGDVWQWDMWQPGMAIVDFTNPHACKWFAEKLEALVDMGVDCFKTDFGERIPTDVVYYDGSDPYKMHNYYTHLYNKVVFNVLKERFGENEATLFARSATVGGQKYPVHWGGDCWAKYESMSESLRGGLSLCLSGFGFWSHDIGGFESTSSADLYMRWAAFGLLSSHSRLHGSTSYRVPWLYGDEAVEVVGFFTKLKCQLMPYLFKNAYETSKTGVPMMRAMVMEFQNDPTCDFIDRQYMLGDSLMVAPIFNSNSEVCYYIPEGKWTNIINNQVVSGGKWVKETHGYLSIPVMARENSIIAIGSNNTLTDYDFTSDVTLHVFELGVGKEASTVIYSSDMIAELQVTVKRTQETIVIESNGTDKNWNVLLRGIFNVASVNGGQYFIDDLGAMITVDKDVKTVMVEYH